MSNPTLEQRVTELEREVAQLKAERANGQAAPKLHEPGPDDWQKTVGMFRGDPVFKEMLDEAKRVREAEREEARKAAEVDDNR